MTPNERTELLAEERRILKGFDHQAVAGGKPNERTVQERVVLLKQASMDPYLLEYYPKLSNEIDEIACELESKPMTNERTEPLSDAFLDRTIEALHRFERGEYMDSLWFKAYVGFALEVCRAEKRRREELKR